MLEHVRIGVMGASKERGKDASITTPNLRLPDVLPRGKPSTNMAPVSSFHQHLVLSRRGWLAKSSLMLILKSSSISVVK